VLSDSIPESITCDYQADLPFDQGQIAHFTQLPQSRTSTFFKLFRKHNLDVLDCINKFWIDERKTSLLEYYYKTSIEILPNQIRKMFELMFFVLTNNDKLVWLMDEPEVNLIGIDQQDTLVDLIKYWGKNKTIIIVSHNVEFTRKIADDILFVQYGKKIEQSKVDEFFASNNQDVQYLIKMGC
jgi:ABC-type branched-subunit amino acid transport system ATPase component